MNETLVHGLVGGALMAIWKSSSVAIRVVRFVAVARAVGHSFWGKFRSRKHCWTEMANVDMKLTRTATHILKTSRQMNAP